MNEEIVELIISALRDEVSEETYEHILNVLDLLLESGGISKEKSNAIRHDCGGVEKGFGLPKDWEYQD